jgi:hypothetical protein
MNRRTWTKVFVLAGMAVMAGSVAQAALLDATVLLERAANSRTLTVRYTGTSAALVELKINGRSVAIRSLDEARSGGETTFPIDTAALEEGSHDVEVRLYNADGKVVGVQTSKIKVDRKGQGPVFIERPTSGATVRGPVEIKLGLRLEMRNLYVSYFVNDELKSLSNLPPYTFMWDTEREKNGWHEIQAWVVDEKNNTFQTDKMRLFVNNPGGRTDRTGSAPLAANQPGGAAPTAGVRGSAPVSAPASPVGPLVKPIAPATRAVKPIAKTASAPVTAVNTIKPAPAALAGTKAIETEPGLALGTQNLRPAPTAPEAIQVAGMTSVPSLISAAPGGAALAPIAITFGSRLNQEGPYQIVLNDRYLEFDVNPRVMNGVPFTPFRHLFQEAGGTVHFEHSLKTVWARGMGRHLWFKIGDDVANIDGNEMRFELAPFIENSRVLVPMSFMVDALKVKVQYDPNTGHVLVSSQSQQKN